MRGGTAFRLLLNMIPCFSPKGRIFSAESGGFPKKKGLRGLNQRRICGKMMEIKGTGALKMRATVISDNIGRGGLGGEWGLCVYIEYGERRILLDAGASGLFAENAEKLGLPLEAVDAAVLSHAHYDHADGMARFFALNQTAKLYVQEDTGEDCWHRRGFIRKYIGIRRGLLEEYRERIVPVAGPYRLFEGASLLPHSTPGLAEIGRREAMYRRRNGRWTPDDFSHEQSLVLELPEGLAVFSSCSHGGAVNILREVSEAFPGRRVLALIGGLHLFNKKDEEVRALAALLRETGVERVWTGRCTGERACGLLRQALGDAVRTFCAGCVIEL